MALELANVMAMERILSEDIPKQAKVISASQQLFGLELTKLSARVRKAIEKEFIFLNSILAQYPIKTFDDYSQISSTHLAQMVLALTRVCQILKNNCVVNQN